MRIDKLSDETAALISYMESEHFSQQVVGKTRWVLCLFKKYCEGAGISEVTIRTAEDFVSERLGFDIYNPEIPIQYAIRFPLLTLFDFREKGTYTKKHTKPRTVDIPRCYDALFHEYSSYLDGAGFSTSTRQKKRLIFAKLVNYLNRAGIHQISDMAVETVYGFLDSLDGFAPKSLRGYKAHTRILLDWLHEKNSLPFSGHDAIPVIHSEQRSKLMSYYSKDEISQILASVDTSDRHGKFTYCVLCFFVYLGMRAGDVVRLKFSDVDWNKDQIRFTQHKTGAPLVLPLLDEVRYPLIDYIKNARHGSCDKEHIFIRLRAPYTAYANGGALFSVVNECFKKSGVDTNGRHKGPHALRHSLATGLMSNDVPISGISDILGHTSTLTTEIYLTIDETHLKDVSLEVPNA